MKKIHELSVPARFVMATLQSILIVILLGMVLFISAGKYNWLPGWLFLSAYGICGWISSVVLFLKVPELLDERRMKHPGTMKWDRFLVLSYQAMYFPILILAGLNERFHYSGISLMLSAVSIALVLLAFLLMTWAPLVNRHLETYIRIQHDRDHKVCEKGPYVFIRHPAYLGLILLLLAMPLSLGSLIGLIPAIIAITLVVIRTNMEDRFLKLELEGYKKYAKKVRFRLIPFLW
jgi:protein-S-isoprenylcysteine O-methyltransferase Ste14